MRFGRGAAAGFATTARDFWGELHRMVTARTHTKQASAHADVIERTRGEIA
jgi:hypothetical protein